MRFKKRMLIPSLLPLLAAALAGLSPSPAPADSNVKVGPIQLTHLAPFAGKYVHLFFVKASEGMIGLKGYQLEFVEIKAAPARQLIAADGTASFDAVTVPKRFANGLVETYTHLFVAITEAQPDPLYLRNRNGVGGSPLQVVDPRLSPQELARLPDSAFQVVTSGFTTKSNVAAHTAPSGQVTLDAFTGLSQDGGRR